MTSLTGTYGSTFRIVDGSSIPWSVAGDTWAKTVDNKRYTFDETTGTLTLSVVRTGALLIVQ